MTKNIISPISQGVKAQIQAANHLRCQFIYKEKFIAHDHVVNILNYVFYQLMLPKQTRAWGLVVHGMPGSGKTQLAHAIANEVGKRYGNSKSRVLVPSISISMTGAREARTIFGRILDELGAPVAPMMRVADREKLALTLMQRAGIKVLLVDEIQDVLSSTALQQRATLDVVKRIMNELGIPVVALGTAKAADAMRTDPHLAARFEHRLLPVWKDNDEMRALLVAIQKMLPLREHSNLASSTLTKFIVTKTDGCLARIVRLVNAAAVFAIQTETECVNQRMLEMALRGVPNPEMFVGPETEAELAEEVT